MSNTHFELNNIYTLSEATHAYANLNVPGHRLSSTATVSLVRGIWNEVSTNNIEYNYNNIINNSIIASESGFYNIGFDVSVIANSINDFGFEIALFLTRDLSEVLLYKTNVRTLFANKKQNISLLEVHNLNAQDKLTLKIKYTKGSVSLKYGALFIFKTDYESNLPKTSGLTDYFKLNEYSPYLISNSIGLNTLTASNTFSNTAGNGTGILFLNNTNNYLSTDSLKFTQVDSIYSSGFTWSLWFKIEQLFEHKRQPGFIHLTSRALVNNLSDGHTLFSLYLDTWTFKFIFDYIDSNNKHHIVITRPYLELFDNRTQFDYQFVSLSFNPSTNYLRLYINSIVSKQLKIQGFKQETNTGDLIIGARYNSSNNNKYNSSFRIADVSLFNRELSQYEIELIYKNSDIINKNNPTFINNLYNNGSNNSVSLPINASSVNFTNTNAIVESVQDRLTSVIAQLASVSSSNVSTYNGSIILTDWILDSNRSVYRKTLLASIHGILNPWNVIVQISYNGLYVVNESLCEIEIDAATNSINFYVNDVPDGRFVGRYIVIGY